VEILTLRLDSGDIQETLKNHDTWMEDVPNTLQQMQEKEENLTDDIINLNEMNTKLDTKVDNVAWKEANEDLVSSRRCATWSPRCAWMWMFIVVRWTRSWPPSSTTSRQWR